MRYILLFLVYTTICCLKTQAQDTSFVILQNQKLLNNNLTSYYSAPALKKINNPVSYTDLQVNYVHQNSDEYIWQKGSGFNNFNINIESFQYRPNRLNIWGTFTYNNRQTKAVNFNETLDYDYVYPYIMSDSVGRDLRDEQYAISGGVSKQLNKTTWALESSFIGKQSIRNRDPRVQNVSANFNITLSVAQELNDQYQLGLALIGERYFQKAKVSFNSELGRPTIFHETGLGNYNRLFANTRDNAEYLGYNYGASIHFVPKNQVGWFAKASYIAESIDKRIKDLDFVMNEAENQKFSAQVGYKLTLQNQARFEIGGNVYRSKVRGIEAKFHNENSQLVELAKENLYNSALNNFGGYISYQQDKSTTEWSATLRGDYIYQKETYALPFNEQKLNLLQIGGDFGINQKLANNLLTAKLGYTYSNPLKADANWNGSANNSMHQAMLINNFNYKNSTLSILDLTTQMAIPMKNSRNFYVGIQGKYVSNYNLRQLGLSSGFVF